VYQSDILYQLQSWAVVSALRKAKQKPEAKLYIKRETVSSLHCRQPADHLRRGFIYYVRK